MENKKIKTNNLKLATLKYYDQSKGVEVSEHISYVLLMVINGVYINPFSPLELYPVFERVPYSNTTLDGEDFGTKLVQLNDINCSGPCYIIIGEKAFTKEEISSDELEEYILNSKCFFKDRTKIADKRMRNFKEPFKMKKIIDKDRENIEKMEEFFKAREKAFEKVKK